MKAAVPVAQAAGGDDVVGEATNLLLDPLLFAAEVLDLEGALVEVGDGGLDALLPPDLARALGWGEEVRLAPRVGDGEPGSRAIGYGAKALEELIDRVRERGAVHGLRWDGPPAARRDVAAAARQRFRFRTNGPIAFASTTPPTMSYLTVHYAVRTLSEESHEMLVAVSINEATLAPVPGLAERVTALRPPPKSGGREAAAGARPLAQVLDAAGREATRVAVERARLFLAAMERRRGRDHERLHAYYESLAREAANPRGRGRHPGRATVDDRLESIHAEYERKVRELEHRYALRVRLRPAAVERLTLQVWQSNCHLRWRRAERALPVVWNPVLHDLEPLACDRCGAGAWAVTVGEDLAVRCRQCEEGANPQG